MDDDFFNDGRSYFRRVEFGKESQFEVSQTKENLIFENKYVLFYNDAVRFPNGTEASFLRIETPSRLDGSIIVAIDHLHRLAVVKQFRYAARVWEVGFPRGFCNPQDVGAFITGWREFSEEVGGQVDIESTWSLGRVLTDSGKLFDAPHIIMSRLQHREAKETYLEQNPDETEVIAHKSGGHWLSYFYLRDMVETGYIVDMFTCATLARLRPHFNENGEFRPNMNILSSPRLLRSVFDFK